MLGAAAMLKCPMCNARLVEPLGKQCRKCQADVSLLAHYVETLRDGLRQAEGFTRAGELDDPGHDLSRVPASIANVRVALDPTDAVREDEIFQAASLGLGGDSERCRIGGRRAGAIGGGGRDADRLGLQASGVLIEGDARRIVGVAVDADLARDGEGGVVAAGDELAVVGQLHVEPGAAAAAAPSKAERRAEAKAKGYEGEMCSECGNFTLVRNGTCMKCDTCGSTTGCS